MFGSSQYGLWGSGEAFFGDHQNAFEISFFLFQMMFCGTAATLLSGAVAERMSFFGYLAATIILSAVIYPVTGHWAWASFYQNGAQGWLQQLGFVDFAGSTVVHSVGGYIALAAIIIIGPRIGRFDSDKPMPVGNNLPMSVLGTLLIWMGWFGFNGGSTLVMNDQVPIIILNTCLAAVWSGLVASIWHYCFHRYVDVGVILNGVIAGLVSITAGCFAVSPIGAMVIGIIAGVLLCVSTNVIEKLQLDDALGVIPAHLVAGVWGTLAVALFADLSILDTGLTRWEQLRAQLIGVTAIGAYSFILSYLLLRWVDKFIPLRVSAADELQGMNVSEHHATTELIDLLASMRQQQHDGSFESPVPVEPFTEVGQIAQQYNLVIGRVTQEISKRDNAISRFRSSERRKSAILDASMDSIIVINGKGVIIEFNPAAEQTFGYMRRQAKGESFIELFIQPDDLEPVRQSLEHQFMTSDGLLRNRRNAIELRRASGDVFPAEVTITSAKLGGGHIDEFTLHIRDVTRQRKLQDKLKQLAYSDPLTGLYNRTFLMETLTTAIARAKHTGEYVTLFFLDLDRFKKINDTLGHKAGDDLLCEVAARLVSVTRETDSIARWGGDEFVVLFTGTLGFELAHTKAQAILSAMRQPMELEGRSINIPTSIGVAISAAGEVNAPELLQQADIAMYSAKERGRDNHQIFMPEMASAALQNFNYEQELAQALDTPDQLRLVYQPKVQGSDGHIVGLEALIRWDHPTDGVLSPGIFIPIAEESDLIIQIGELVIRNVVDQMVAWRQAGHELVPVSVNISERHLVSERLIPFVREQLSRASLDGSLLEFEITEGVLLTDIERCIEVMSLIKALKIKISIDDFGTGYSSLNYLKRLPIDVLKIDRSFIDECASTVEDGQICATIISLASNLDLSTVAEGVETQEQLDFLVAQGCSIFQGFYFYKPASPKDIATYLCQFNPTWCVEPDPETTLIDE
jgi:Amt family ammonium transporter